MCLLFFQHKCLIYIYFFRLESLCKSDNGKVRLRMGDLAATFQLNSSLVPGQIFNCHLELSVDSSTFGKLSKATNQQNNVDIFRVFCFL